MLTIQSIPPVLTSRTKYSYTLSTLMEICANSATMLSMDWKSTSDTSIKANRRFTHSKQSRLTVGTVSSSTRKRTCAGSIWLKARILSTKILSNFLSLSAETTKLKFCSSKEQFTYTWSVKRMTFMSWSSMSKLKLSGRLEISISSICSP